MESIATQFWGETKLDVDVIALIKKVYDPKASPNFSQNKPLPIDMWVIGPRDIAKNSLFLTGFSLEGGVLIIPVKNIAKGVRGKDIYVKSKLTGEWYYCDLNKAASSYAKTMDILLRNGYSDVWNVHAGMIADNIGD